MWVRLCVYLCVNTWFSGCGGFNGMEWDRFIKYLYNLEHFRLLLNVKHQVHRENDKRLIYRMVFRFSTDDFSIGKNLSLSIPNLKVEMINHRHIGTRLI